MFIFYITKTVKKILYKFWFFSLRRVDLKILKNKIKRRILKFSFFFEN